MKAEAKQIKDGVKQMKPCNQTAESRPAKGQNRRETLQANVIKIRKQTQCETKRTPCELLNLSAL